MATSPTLAERATACAGWHWLPGMADTDGNRCERVVDGAPCFRMPGPDGLVRCPDAVPDLDDGLTVLGVLLLVREAWRRPRIGTVAFRYTDGLRWCVTGISSATRQGHASEAEALVAALERAP